MRWTMKSKAFFTMSCRVLSSMKSTDSEPERPGFDSWLHHLQHVWLGFSFLVGEMGMVVTSTYQNHYEENLRPCPRCNEEPILSSIVLRTPPSPTPNPPHTTTRWMNQPRQSKAPKGFPLSMRLRMNPWAIPSQPTGASPHTASLTDPGSLLPVCPCHIPPSILLRPIPSLCGIHTHL